MFEERANFSFWYKIRLSFNNFLNFISTFFELPTTKWDFSGHFPLRGLTDNDDDDGIKGTSRSPPDFCPCETDFYWQGQHGTNNCIDYLWPSNFSVQPRGSTPHPLFDTTVFVGLGGFRCPAQRKPWFAKYAGGVQTICRELWFLGRRKTTFKFLGWTQRRRGRRRYGQPGITSRHR